MKISLVVDANVVFSALIKNNVSYLLLFSDNFILYSPEFILIEIEKHKAEILKKTQKSEEEFLKVLAILKRRINLIPSEEIFNYIKEAEKISPDPKDITYVALALKLKCVIWSQDKPLKEKQNTVTVYNTQEIMNL